MEGEDIALYLSKIFNVSGGTCVESLDRISGVECKCKSGYFGSFCEMVLVDCRVSGLNLKMNSNCSDLPLYE